VEPPAFTPLLRRADRREDVLATIASRCQPVRFDPLPAAVIARRLAERGGGAEPAEGAASAGRVSSERAQACARLALGDAGLAARLASDAGEALRARAEDYVRSALAGETGRRPWLELLELAKQAGAAAGERAQARTASELELVPSKERKRYEREAAESRRRGERRERTRTLDLGLRLAELWLRDVLCLREGAPELIYAVDRRGQLEQDADGRDAVALRRGVELVADARLSLSLNVSEELALEALAYRLQAALGDGAVSLSASVGVS
jgi:DNA polymerase-3 subunit delta'